MLAITWHVLIGENIAMVDQACTFRWISSVFQQIVLVATLSSYGRMPTE